MTVFLLNLVKSVVTSGILKKYGVCFQKWLLKDAEPAIRMPDSSGNRGITRF